MSGQDGHATTQDTTGGQGSQQGEGPSDRSLQPKEGAAAGGALGEAAARRAFLEARVRGLEEEIAAWRRRNSQSNPSAVWDLRELKKELEWWRGWLTLESSS